MRRYLFWILAALTLSSCVPAFNAGTVVPAPAGSSLTLGPGEGYHVVTLTLAEPGDVWLVVTGDVRAAASECVPAADEIRCRVGQVNQSYTLPVAGEVTGAAALVCAESCYALRLSPEQLRAASDYDVR